MPDERKKPRTMTRKPLPVGVENFEMLVTRGYFFIDKTWLIKDLLDQKSTVNLFTRPRRFGKTLNMSMLQYFFEDERERDGSKKDNQALFDGLAIMDAGKPYLSHMGKYPVISLTLKEASQPNFQTSYTLLTYEIAREYDRHSFICDRDCLEPHEKEKYRRIMAWNFMFFTGYFRKACQWADSDGHQYAELAIPNRESGYGRSDLILQPITRRKAAFGLKFKIAKSFSELREKAQEALWQIEEKQYQQELNNDGYAVVHKYGIAFFGKDCLVRLGTENEDSE